MARGKRRAPIQPEVVLPPEYDPAVVTKTRTSIKQTDEVDDFVAQRHKVLLDKPDDESDSEPDNQVQVFNIDMSDSDEDDDDSSASDEEDGDPNAAPVDDEKKSWGGRRRSWYGGDTHEYEIMDEEEREEALKDEEEEAVRLQKKSLSTLLPEDFQDADDDTEADDEEDDDDDDADGADLNADVAGDVLHAAAPEVPLLVKELVQCREQAALWKERVQWGELARLRYHLNASLVSNVAFYLLLRTDPDSEKVNHRTHPVMLQIGKVRNLLKNAMSLPCEEPVVKENIVQVDAVPETNALRVEKNNESPVEETTNEAMEKKKKKRKSAKRKKKSKKAIDDDEKRLESMFLSENRNGVEKETEEDRSAQKRRKLNQIVGAIENERKNKSIVRLASADADMIRKEPTRLKNTGEVLAAPVGNNADADIDFEDMDDDDAIMKRMIAKKAKKEAKVARRAQETKPHVYRFKDEVEPDARRKASYQVVSNRGLTRHRPKDKKTPRTKNRLAYQKAIGRRKSTVTEYAGKPGGGYGGESSGINQSARKGSKLGSV